jgi:hypothetical protein
VVLPDAVYLRMPAAGGNDDRPWVRVDPSSTDPADEQMIALADQLTERADLTVTLSRYADATLISDATDDVIGGDPAVRYTIVTDLAAPRPPPPTRPCASSSSSRCARARPDHLDAVGRRRPPPAAQRRPPGAARDRDAGGHEQLPRLGPGRDDRAAAAGPGALMRP